MHPRWTTRARLRRRIAALERERTKLRQANAALAAHDPVSGLPRFPFFARDLAAAIAAAAAAGGRIVLLYLDLDNLHLVNQTRGQDAGDQVLRSLAARLGGLAADRGLLAHVASDEFVLALADDGSTDQVELGERVRRLCEEPIELDGEPLFVTVSIGVSCFPDQAATSQELLREAEAAMQQAKQVGRNAVRAFTRAQRQDLEERLLLGLSLREALRKQQFVVLYQPQISTRDWRISGLTARIRWHNPKLGPLPAERFLPIAAELGLSIEIDDFLLDQACRQIRALHDEGLEHFVVSVEISAPRLRRPNFVDTVRTMLNRRRAAARCLELALSEPTAADVLHALRMLGVRLALDDFGSRWSELRRLGHCPIERLRLDPRLLHDLCTDSATAAVCRALINLGHRFGMSVLADGVDTAAQVGPLLRYECDALQGSYFGAPVSAERARVLLTHRESSPSGSLPSKNWRTLLLLDDEENVLRALTRVLRRDGYRILTAATPREAFQHLARHDVQVILSDQRMPESNGTEFLRQVKAMYPDTVRMLLSGYSDVAAVREALAEGAIAKFLTKPWNDEDLRRQIEDAFQIASRSRRQTEVPDR